MTLVGRDRRPEREQMVELQISSRGIRNARLLEAIRDVPRELFVPEPAAEFAYHDVALSIPAGQTISQPYVVALMLDALELRPEDRVLEVGAGSGYAAAVAGRLCRSVVAVERHEELVRSARERLAQARCDNVVVELGDGTLALAGEPPFDAILVSAGAPHVPRSLRDQLRVGGRLVIPVGDDPREQVLWRLRRVNTDEWREEQLAPVHFVPLVGEDGWPEHGRSGTVARRRSPAEVVADAAEPFTAIERADLTPLLERVDVARLVLLGEASHGTSEFYRMRARITRELIERRGFRTVAVEADWPEAARIDRYVRGGAREEAEEAFARFPTWMWRNHEVMEFVEWLHDWNGARPPEDRVSFRGLDLYSLSASIAEVLRYLDRVAPDTAQLARRRYACLTPFQSDPGQYGLAALTEGYRTCERDVLAMLMELHRKRAEYLLTDGEGWFDAQQNARLAASAERYYRAMYYSGPEAWNLRDTHMFETLEALLAAAGQHSRAVVWAHNSHLGDAAHTQMSARGEINLGHLVRRAYGTDAYLVGFGTDHGTVAAASEWDGHMEIKQVRPSHPDSYEKLCHESGVGTFLLHLRAPPDGDLRAVLVKPRLERAIGVIYRPESERRSHYFEAVLPRQFDEWVWFDSTEAVRPVGRGPQAVDLPRQHPFALFDA